MNYLEYDDVIYSIQKFGGATTYWNELTSRVSEFVPGIIKHSIGAKISRLFSPRSSAKVFHSSHFRIATGKDVKNVTTIYDLIYEKSLAGGRGKLLNLYERKRAVTKADAIICISESTRSDMYEYYGGLIGEKPVYVIHLGCSNGLLNSDEKKSKYVETNLIDSRIRSGNFFIFVGGRAAYKNFDLFLRAFSRGKFGPSGFFIVCTGAAFSESERKLVDELKLNDFIVPVGFVSAVMLASLYGLARALVYPSAYEGFGLPPLEAMAQGCPVICANSSSLPEVVGSAGVLINPSSIDELVVAMNLVLKENERVRLCGAGIERSKLFDWRSMAKSHAKVYAELVPF